MQFNLKPLKLLVYRNSMLYARIFRPYRDLNRLSTNIASAGWRTLNPCLR